MRKKKGGTKAMNVTLDYKVQLQKKRQRTTGFAIIQRLTFN